MAHEELLRQGTYREQLVKLQAEIRDTIEAGAATPQGFEATLTQLLKAVEGLRVKQEQEIRRLEKQIAFCQATQRNCATFANLILGVVTARRNEAVREAEADAHRPHSQLDEVRTLLEDARAGGDEERIRELEAEEAELLSLIERSKRRSDRRVVAQTVSEAVAEDAREHREEPEEPEPEEPEPEEPEPEEPEPEEPVTVDVRQKPTPTKHKPQKGAKRKGAKRKR